MLKSEAPCAVFFDVTYRMLSCWGLDQGHRRIRVEGQYICMYNVNMSQNVECFHQEAVKFRRWERVTRGICEAYRGKNEPQPTFNSKVGTYTAVLKNKL